MFHKYIKNKKTTFRNDFILFNIKTKIYILRWIKILHVLN